MRHVFASDRTASEPSPLTLSDAPGAIGAEARASVPRPPSTATISDRPPLGRRDVAKHALAQCIRSSRQRSLDIDDIDIVVLSETDVRVWFRLMFGVSPMRRPMLRALARAPTARYATAAPR
jgi:hypothetical protein